jgi:endo-1,4-beta-xylanase
MLRCAVVFILFFLLSFTAADDMLCGEVRLFEQAPFPVGTALNTDKLKNEESYWKAALQHYNSFTPEKVMKPQYLHPRKDQFSFTELDHLVEFCRQRSIRLHGHTLVWHKALPPWIENFKGTPTEWDALLKEHIEGIVNHCRGSVKSWDVVNEAFNDDGTLRNSVWLKNMGESYIEKAFIYAAAADPGAQLFYNDYTLEKNDRKLKAVLDLFRELKAKGIKVDGIGMQMHVSLSYPPVEDINAAARSIASEGFKVHYSELDVSLTADQPLFVGRKKLLRLQAARMKEIVAGYMKLKPESRFGITLWGVSDNDSWLTEEHVRSRPLLLNMRYKIKPAFCGFIEGLKAKP